MEHLDELHVGHREALLGAEIVDMLPRYFQLLVGHVHARDEAVFSHQSSGDVAVAPAARTQVEDAAPGNAQRDRRSAAIEFVVYLSWDRANDTKYLRVWPACRRAGAGSQILGAAEHLPVVVLHRLVGVLHA